MLSKEELDIKFRERYDNLHWKDVLYPDKIYNDILEIWDMACLTNYEFFCWNDMIYHTSNCYNTGLEIKNIKK